MLNFWQKLKQTHKPILAMAPMAGITDSAWRRLCREYGADVLYTEMISADGLFYDAEKTLEMLKCHSRAEKPVVAQLFGKRPECFAKAAKIVEKNGYDGIDINFGCPARKVVGHGGGVSLLRDLNLCHKIIEAVTSNTKLPVSVKTRVAINKPIREKASRAQSSVAFLSSETLVKEKAKEDKSTGRGKITVLDFLKKIKDLPISALMLHGRTYEQGFTGPINTKIFSDVRKLFLGVILANGGINTPEEAANILKLTQADGLGIARGAYGRPWLFQQIKDYLKTDKYKPLTITQIKKVAMKHAKYLDKTKGEHGLMELRKHLCWYFQGFPNASEWRKRLVLIKSVGELEKILKELQ